MRRILTICLCLLLANLYSQNKTVIESDTMNLVDNNGLKQGIWILTDKNGNTRMKCNYIDNKIDKTINYYMDDQIKLIYTIGENGNFSWSYILNESDTIRGVTKYIDSKFRLLLENGEQLDNKTNVEIITISEVFPTYYGGDMAMYKYIQENLIYPEKAKSKGKTGKVIVQFTIDQNGGITNVKVIESSSKIFNNEALRVVQQMPNWRPGHQRGKMVKVSMNLPISFNLNN